ncbi:uncharacterized protein LAESUDRAFT_403506 [Laetiporus sulphureus 93-53]|uniref:HIT domain-containing protein n=1 Tax=Laetiporus sulphureus 93-53 TaxID=1314785 RepID=A0A165CCQ8_9APHY|nr:uncharacterized protein LAESUDRAFT_403506 [Laetiporus sulphureus 93-53]KZT02573.1 hypothetical protein LAESUDRAFT_403506 [Laetiporus sulphureus 93-53]
MKSSWYFGIVNQRPAHHLLVSPRQHIDSVKSLSKADASLVRHMAQISHRLLDDLHVPVHDRRLGFHIPLFYSVSHLHLHVQGLSYRSMMCSLKYPICSGEKHHSKGLSWFVEAEQAVEILEQGGRVGVLPC